MDPFSEPLTFSDGVFTVPNGPGLGVELNQEMVRKYSLDFEASG